MNFLSHTLATGLPGSAAATKLPQTSKEESNNTGDNDREWKRMEIDNSSSPSGFPICFSRAGNLRNAQVAGSSPTTSSIFTTQTKQLTTLYIQREWRAFSAATTSPQTYRREWKRTAEHIPPYAQVAGSSRQIPVENRMKNSPSFRHGGRHENR